MNFILLDIPVIFGLSIEVYFILLVIAIPTFFFWQWLLKKYIKVGRTRKIATWSATLIATPTIYVSLIVLFMLGMTCTPSKDFDKSQWLTDEEGRFQMAGDIISSKMLIGKDTNHVKQVLGEPIWSSESTWRSDTINTWTYDMGMGGGRFHNLIIEFDKDKVVAVEHAKIRD